MIGKYTAFIEPGVFFLAKLQFDDSNFIEVLDYPPPSYTAYSFDILLYQKVLGSWYYMTV